MAGAAVPLWQLAHHLHAHEPLVEERGVRPGVRTLQQKQIVRLKLEVVSMDGTIVKVHRDGTGALRMGHGRRGGEPPRSMKQEAFG